MTTTINRVTFEEYLASERAAETKSEFFDGEMFAMAGGTAFHNLISTSFSARLLSALAGRCKVFNSDMKVKSPLGLYAYPDVSVSCEEPRYENNRKDVLVNPTLIIEVLTPATEAYDRGRKFKQYQSIASLRTYILVSQDESNIDMFTRQSDETWLLTSVQSGELIIPEPECKISLAAIYEQVEFPAVIQQPATSDH